MSKSTKRKAHQHLQSNNPFTAIIRQAYPDVFIASCMPPQKKTNTKTKKMETLTLALEDIHDLCSDIVDGEETEEVDDTEEKPDKFEELLVAENYDGAITEADDLLANIPPLQDIARAALVRGKGILLKAMTQISKTGEPVPQQVFKNVWSAFELSSKLNPDCADTQAQIERLSGFLREYELVSKKNNVEITDAPDYDVIVVGAGASGIGTALTLTQFGLDKSRVLIIERGDDVGTSFRKWPKEMRFISPSFNQQGWTDSFDLNSISFGTSPAFSLHSEHPSGDEYAQYLKAIATTNELKIQFDSEVESIRPSEKEPSINEEKKDDSELVEPPLFSVDIRTKEEVMGADEEVTETLTAHYVVWAAGEFQYAKPSGFPGADLCLHNSQVHSWKDLEGDDFIVIGGYESGVDACVNLAKAGKKAKVLASTPCWDVKLADPSAELAPYTATRLREVMSPSFAGPSPHLYAPLRVVAVEKGDGGYCVTARWQDKEENDEAPLRQPTKVACQELGLPGTQLFLKSPNRPILATGFEGSVRAAASHLFSFADDDHPHKGCLGNAPLLTEDDQSTKVPGLFLVGPQVQHDSLSFCFVYKFRQRFGVVASAICQGLGLDTKHAESECRNNNMYLDNFETCADTCGDVC